MKVYGNLMKAVEISRKQVSVIYARAKAGDLKVESWFMNDMYTLTSYYGYDSNLSVERDEADVQGILKAVFAGDYAKAQELINETEDRWYNSYSRKNQAKCNRAQMI